MKKFLLALLAIVCLNNLFAADTIRLVLKVTGEDSTEGSAPTHAVVPPAISSVTDTNTVVVPTSVATSVSAIWTYDLDSEEPKATRTIGDDVTVFNVLRERSAGDESAGLPENAIPNAWYPITRSGVLRLKSEDGSETISDHSFTITLFELMFRDIVADIDPTTMHGHYGAGYQRVSRLKKKTFYPCWSCCLAAVTREFLRRTPGNTDIAIIATESLTPIHVKGADICEFTNPAEQDCGTGKITPAPSGAVQSAASGGTTRNTLMALIRKF